MILKWQALPIGQEKQYIKRALLDARKMAQKLHQNFLKLAKDGGIRSLVGIVMRLEIRPIEGWRKFRMIR